jgi:GNAT superfamily N-acetyltransferase
MREFEQAIEVFVRGFAFGRSFTHPFEVRKSGTMWVARDAPRRNPRHYRVEEWIAYDIPPRDIDRLARHGARSRFFVCMMLRDGQHDAPIRADFRCMTYRLLRIEPFMLHRLSRIPRFTCPFRIERVRSEAQASRLAQAARTRQVLREHLGDPRSVLRQYVALDGDEPIGWLRSITVATSGWCSNVYVKPGYRRRGIGRAMLARMLRDDRAAGLKRSVLLASQAGARLYPVVGYEPIGRLLIYAPPRRLSN